MKTILFVILIGVMLVIAVDKASAKDITQQPTNIDKPYRAPVVIVWGPGIVTPLSPERWSGVDLFWWLAKHVAYNQPPWNEHPS